ncbi:MAG: OmpA family protein [SAR324 cluster bacterium]|nr:OmpA family protein [SAR324 cluster bacterium]
MANRKDASTETPAWVVSFADLMSLLFSFFVLLTTLSTQPKNCEGIREYMENNKAFFKNYELRSTKLSCIVSLPQDYLFKSGQGKIQPSAFKALTPFFEKIRDLPEHREDLLIVEGHTDNVPIHTREFPSNWELSSARATNISVFMMEKLKFARERLSVSAYADSRPKTPYVDTYGKPLTGKDLQNARQTNRRVEIILTTPPKSLEETTMLFDGRE